jgi:hypothetical protein
MFTFVHGVHEKNVNMINEKASNISREIMNGIIQPHHYKLWLAGQK